MDTEQSVQYLCVKIRGHWLGVDVANIVEIVKPGAGDSAGLRVQGDMESFDYRGDMLPIIRLADVLLGEQVKYDASRRILISEMAEKRAGIIVDSAEEIVRAQHESIKSIDNTISGLNTDILEGILEIDDRKIHIVSLDRIYHLSSVK